MNPRSLAQIRLSMHTAVDGTDQLLLVARDGRCYSASSVAAGQGVRVPATLDSLLQSDSPRLDDTVVALWQAIDDPAYAGPGQVEHPRYAPLVRQPGKIICVGQNFRRHAEEMGAPLPKWPVLFSKFNNALSAPDGVVTLPPATVAIKYDYETELVVVIGQTIAAADATGGEVMSRVAGYCIGHDLTARDLQKERGGQWLLGKTLEGFAPIGPDFVGAALAGDSSAMRIETRRNGEVVQSSSTADFIFPVEAVLRYVARHFPLRAGDVIFTGTPEGVIAGKPPAEQHWLRAGDRLESQVGGLGTLRFQLA